MADTPPPASPLITDTDPDDTTTNGAQAPEEQEVEGPPRPGIKKYTDWLASGATLPSDSFSDLEDPEDAEVASQIAYRTRYRDYWIGELLDRDEYKGEETESQIQEKYEKSVKEVLEGYASSFEVPDDATEKQATEVLNQKITDKIIPAAEAASISMDEGKITSQAEIMLGLDDEDINSLGSSVGVAAALKDRAGTDPQEVLGELDKEFLSIANTDAFKKAAVHSDQIPFAKVSGAPDAEGKPTYEIIPSPKAIEDAGGLSKAIKKSIDSGFIDATDAASAYKFGEKDVNTGLTQAELIRMGEISALMPSALRERGSELVTPALIKYAQALGSDTEEEAGEDYFESVAAVMNSSGVLPVGLKIDPTDDLFRKLVKQSAYQYQLSDNPDSLQEYYDLEKNIIKDGLTGLTYVHPGAMLRPDLLEKSLEASDLDEAEKTKIRDRRDRVARQFYYSKRPQVDGFLATESGETFADRKLAYAESLGLEDVNEFNVDLEITEKYTEELKQLRQAKVDSGELTPAESRHYYPETSTKSLDKLYSEFLKDAKPNKDFFYAYGMVKEFAYSPAYSIQSIPLLAGAIPGKVGELIKETGMYKSAEEAAVQLARENAEERASMERFGYTPGFGYDLAVGASGLVGQIATDYVLTRGLGSVLKLIASGPAGKGIKNVILKKALEKIVSKESAKKAASLQGAARAKTLTEAIEATKRLATPSARQIAGVGARTAASTYSRNYASALMSVQDDSAHASKSLSEQREMAESIALTTTAVETALTAGFSRLNMDAVENLVLRNATPAMLKRSLASAANVNQISDKAFQAIVRRALVESEKELGVRGGLTQLLKEVTGEFIEEGAPAFVDVVATDIVLDRLDEDKPLLPQLVSLFARAGKEAAYEGAIGGALGGGVGVLRRGGARAGEAVTGRPPIEQLRTEAAAAEALAQRISNNLTDADSPVTAEVVGNLLRSKAQEFDGMSREEVEARIAAGKLTPEEAVRLGLAKPAEAETEAEAEAAPEAEAEAATEAEAEAATEADTEADTEAAPPTPSPEAAPPSPSPEDAAVEEEVDRIIQATAQADPATLTPGQTPLDPKVEPLSPEQGIDSSTTEPGTFTPDPERPVPKDKDLSKKLEGLSDEQSTTEAAGGKVVYVKDIDEADSVIKGNRSGKGITPKAKKKFAKADSFHTTINGTPVTFVLEENAKNKNTAGLRKIFNRARTNAAVSKLVGRDDVTLPGGETEAKLNRTRGYKDFSDVEKLSEIVGRITSGKLQLDPQRDADLISYLKDLAGKALASDVASVKDIGTKLSQAGFTPKRPTQTQRGVKNNETRTKEKRPTRKLEGVLDDVRSEYADIIQMIEEIISGISEDVEISYSEDVSTRATGNKIFINVKQFATDRERAKGNPDLSPKEVERNFRAYVDRVIDEEVRHIASFRAVPDAMKAKLIKETSDDDFQYIIDTYMGFDPKGAEEARRVLKSDDESAVKGMKLMLVEEFLRQNSQDRTGGFTTEETIQFLIGDKKRTFREVVRAYLESMFRLITNKTKNGRPLSNTERAALVRIQHEVNLITNNFQRPMPTGFRPEGYPRTPASDTKTMLEAIRRRHPGGEAKAPAFREAPSRYNEIADRFMEFFPEDASIDEVEAEMEALPAAERNFYRALGREDWLGFDYPAQAIDAILMEPDNFELSPQVKTALGRYVNTVAGSSPLLQAPRISPKQVEFIGDEDFDGEGLSEEDNSRIDQLEKESGINILRGKEVSAVVRAADSTVIGVLYTEFSGGEFSFDIIVAPEAQGQGIGSALIDAGISDGDAQTDYGEFGEIKLDVVNPDMVAPLKRRGFVVGEEVAGHTLMERGKESILYAPRISNLDARDDAAYMDAIDRGDYDMAEAALNRSAERYGVEDPVIVFRDDNGDIMLPSQRFMARPSMLSPEKIARHKELEAKHDAGTITPEETAEAERMVGEAAKAAGYDTKVWHGTNAEFDTFQPSRIGNFGPGIYVAFDPVEAGKYARRSQGSRIIAGFAKVDNPFEGGDANSTAERFFDAFPGRSDAETVQKAKDAGYDAVVATQPLETKFGTSGPQMMLFNPNQIKSADPFTGVPIDERFDPREDSILYSPPIFMEDHPEAALFDDVKDISIRPILETLDNPLVHTNDLNMGNAISRFVITGDVADKRVIESMVGTDRTRKTMDNYIRNLYFAFKKVIDKEYNGFLPDDVRDLFNTAVGTGDIIVSDEDMGRLRDSLENDLQRIENGTFREPAENEMEGIRASVIRGNPTLSDDEIAATADVRFKTKLKKEAIQKNKELERQFFESAAEAQKIKVANALVELKKGGHDKLVQKVAEARNAISELTQYAKENFKSLSEDLQLTFDETQGFYLTRKYRFFNDPDYRSALVEDILLGNKTGTFSEAIDGALDFFSSQVEKQALKEEVKKRVVEERLAGADFPFDAETGSRIKREAEEEVSKRDFDQKANAALVEFIESYGDRRENILTGEFAVTLKDTVLRQKKDIPPALRKLLGEYETEGVEPVDAFKVMLNTINYQTAMLTSGMRAEHLLSMSDQIKNAGGEAFILSETEFESLKEKQPTEALRFKKLTQNGSLSKYNSLKDKYILAEFVDALEKRRPGDGMEVSDMTAAHRAWNHIRSFIAFASAMAMMTKTSMAGIAFHLRNLSSSAFKSVGSGAIFSPAFIGQMLVRMPADALVALPGVPEKMRYLPDKIAAMFRGESISLDEFAPLHHELEANGVINQNIKSAALKDMVERSFKPQMGDVMREIEKFESPGAGGFTRRVLIRYFNYLQKLQNSTDNGYRMSTYYRNVALLKKAREKGGSLRGVDLAKMDDAAIKKEAARMVNKITPGEDNLVNAGKLITETDLALLAGPFARFKFETIRAYTNLFGETLTMLRSDNPILRIEGARRFAGAMAITGVSFGPLTFLLSKLLGGFDQEEQDILDESNPSFAKTTQFIRTRTKDGKLDPNGPDVTDWQFSYMNEFSFLGDPFSYAIQRIRQGDSVAEASADTIVDFFFNDLLDDQILAGTIARAINNQDEYGDKIISDQDKGWEPFKKIAKYIYEGAFEPASLKGLQESMAMYELEDTPSDKANSAARAFMGRSVMPTKPFTSPIVDRMERRLSQLGRDLREAREEYRDPISKETYGAQKTKRTRKEIEDFADGYFRRVVDIYEDAYKVIEAYKGMDVPEQTIEAALNEKLGVRQAAASRILRTGDVEMPGLSRGQIESLKAFEDLKEAQERVNIFVEARRRYGGENMVRRLGMKSKK